MLWVLGKHNCGLRVLLGEQEEGGRELREAEERGKQRGKGAGREKRRRSRRQDRTEAERKIERAIGGGGEWGRWLGKGQMERHKEGEKAVAAPEPGCAPMLALPQLFWRC